MGAITLVPDGALLRWSSYPAWEKLIEARTRLTTTASARLKRIVPDSVTDSSNAPSAFRTAEIHPRRIVDAISATGTIAPVALVVVSTQVSGQIQQIHADFNAEVQRGDPIASFDPTSFQNTLDQTKAELSMAQAILLKAQIGWREADSDVVRKRYLFSTGSGSAIDRSRAEANKDLAEATVLDATASVEKWRAAVNQAATNLERTVIRSPVDGTVINRNVEVGQVIAASLSTPTLFTIAQDLREMQVNVSVSEGDIGRARPGQTIEFTVDTYSERVFRGKVTQIRKQPQTTQNVVTYTVVASAPNPDRVLLPGMTATARFIVNEALDVLSVPTVALRFRLPGEPRTGSSRVLVERNGVAVPVSVKVGISDGKMTAIESDEIQAGDRVIVGLPLARKPGSEGRSVIGGF